MRKAYLFGASVAAVFAASALADDVFEKQVHVDRGWYNSTGAHTPTNDNYIVGNLGTTDYNNWFVYAIAAGDPIVAARLQLQNPSGGYSGPANTYTLYDYVGSIASLIAGTGGVAAWTDLQSGVIFGSKPVSTADNGTTVVVDLNAAGVAALNAAMGGSIAIGGSMNGTGTNYLFGFSGGALTTHLALKRVVPAPGALALLGLAGVASRRRRRA